jgi:glycosyltransferase involved in cell wall biosynthesis
MSFRKQIDGSMSVGEELERRNNTGKETLYTITPLASVQMLSYNHEPYIARAIEGVINQKTDFPFELVIGEDCSTDKTRQIVLEYQEKYPDIINVISSNNNVGMFQNCLRTEKACRGKYIAYCEGDDYWHHPLKLQMQVDYLESHPDYGMVHSNAYHFHVKNEKYEKSIYKFQPDFDDGNAYFDILTGKRPMATLTVCAKKNLISEVLKNNPECSDEHYLMADLQRWLEMSRLAKVKYLSETLATYNILLESASTSQDLNKALRFQLSAKEIRYHYLLKYDCPIEVDRQTRYSSIVRVFNYAVHAKNAEVAKREILELREMNLSPPWKDYILYWGCSNRIINYFVEFMRKIWSLKNI